MKKNRFFKYIKTQLIFLSLLLSLGIGIQGANLNLDQEKKPKKEQGNGSDADHNNDHTIDSEAFDNLILNGKKDEIEQIMKKGNVDLNTGYPGSSVGSLLDSSSYRPEVLDMLLAYQPQDKNKQANISELSLRRRK